MLLATGLALGATIGCDAGIRVTGFGQAGGGAGGSTGGSGGGGGSSALAGTWRNLSSLVLSTGETVVFDVRWSFGAGGDCSRTRIQTVIGGTSGTETTDTRNCTYTASAGAVTVVFEGSSVPASFSVAFLGGDLLLGGTRFTRIG